MIKEMGDNENDDKKYSNTWTHWWDISKIFTSRCICCLIIYWAVVLDFGFLVIPIVVFGGLLLENQSSKNTLKNKRKGIIFNKLGSKEKPKFVSTSNDSLPSWVLNPDVERTEWINQIIQQLWPSLSEYIGDKLNNIQFSPKVDSFMIINFTLGDSPPRIGGVKVFTGHNIPREMAILDLEICYVGNTEFNVGFKSEIIHLKNIELSGTIRISIDPLLPYAPFIGGISASFLSQPHISFDLSDTARLFETPGIYEVLHSAILSVLSEKVVHPNTISVPFYKDWSPLSLKMPQGVVHIHAVEARGLCLTNKNIFFVKQMQPICVFTVGAQVFKTKILDQRNQWDEYFEAIVGKTKDQFITVQILNLFNKDVLGSAAVNLEHLVSHGKLKAWFKLEKIANAEVLFEFTWFNLSSNWKKFNFEPKNSELNFLSRGLLAVFLDSANNLTSIFLRKKQRGIEEENPSAYVSLRLGKQQALSNVCSQSGTPLWQETFNFLLIDPEQNNLKLKIKDKSSDVELGRVEVSLEELLSERNMTQMKPYFFQTGAIEGFITMRLTLRALNRSPEFSIGKRATMRIMNYSDLSSSLRLTLKYVLSDNTLILQIHEAQKVNSGTYIKIRTSPVDLPKTKRYTKTVWGTTQPIFDETIHLQIRRDRMSSDTVIMLSFFQENSFVDSKLRRKPDSMTGQVTIPILDIDYTRPVTSWYPIFIFDEVNNPETAI